MLLIDKLIELDITINKRFYLYIDDANKIRYTEGNLYEQ